MVGLERPRGVAVEWGLGLGWVLKWRGDFHGEELELELGPL